MQKLFVIMVMPLSLTLDAALLSLVLALTGRRRAAAALGTAATLALFTASLPRVAGCLVGSLERENLPVPVNESQNADAIVILGGSVASKTPPRLGPELVDSSDRILHAARLYRAGKAPVVVVSGGRGFGSDPTLAPESTEMAELLQEWGVPKDAILAERSSRSTHENGVETKRLLAGKRTLRVLLVTSAIHMKRAILVYRKAGFDVVPSPTDFAFVERVQSSPFDFVPDVGALAGTSAALKERIGLVYYRLRGWV